MTRIQKFVTVTGSILTFLVALFTVVVYFVIDSQQKDLNRKKTGPMRDARWKPKDVQEAEVVENPTTTNEENKQNSNSASDSNDPGPNPVV